MDLSKTLGPWLGKTTKMLACLVNESFQNNNIDLTRKQWIFLMRLHQNDGLPQNELAHISERDKTSLTRFIKTMERKELIKRRVSDSDKRSKLVYLTDKGKASFIQARPVMQKLIYNLQEGLNPSEIQLVIDVLQKFQMNIKKHSDNCATHCIDNKNK